MHLPRLRFTVRRMMLAVAILACILAVAAMAFRSYEGKRRVALFRALAEYHMMMEWKSKREIYGTDSAGHHRHFSAPTPRNDFHRQMREKYERAARDPWLPVAPDPPVPK